ncbi:MAG: class I SAM-dependent methyltransferase [Candidatus Woesearchaeota archaeon]|nr:class I SAM-dependent methyltransferase [Candidatus Woesearchaeota archaeon]
MSLADSIGRVDKGGAWGQFESEETDRTFLDSEESHVSALVAAIRTYKKGTHLKFVDLGGATGRIAEQVLRAVGNEYDISATVLDIDRRKLKEHPVISFTQHDARQPFPDSYDVVCARYLLHYNSYREQQTICNNIAAALTSHGHAFLIDTIPPDENERKRWNEVCEAMTRMKGSNEKFWSLEEEIITMMSAAGLSLATRVPDDLVPYSAQDFWKARYDLTAEQTRNLDTLLECKPVVGSVPILEFTRTSRAG